MSRKQISYITAAWIALCLMLAVAWRAEALLLLLLPAVVRPLLREGGWISGVDERERVLDYQASHYALGLLYLLLIAIFVYALFVEGENPSGAWYLALAVPMITRAMVYVGKKDGARKLGLGLGISFGAGWTLFALLSHGFSLGALAESVIGLAILGATLVALPLPRVGGALLAVVGLALAVIFLDSQAYQTAFVALLMAIILPLPPFIAGLALLFSARPSAKDEFADLRSSEANDGGK
jgi:hypothetical protein